MRYILFSVAVLTVIIFGFGFLLSSLGNLSANQTIGLYPDKNLTPGKFDTLNIAAITATYQCGSQNCTYSQSHRNVPDSEKRQVEQEYPACPSKHEIDHLYPVAIGGSNDIQNLWCQPEHVIVNGQDFGFHTKDRLEDQIIKEVKAQTMTPKAAFDCLTIDWVSCYNKEMKGLGANPIEDGDDIITPGIN